MARLKKSTGDDDDKKRRRFRRKKGKAKAPCDYNSDSSSGTKGSCENGDLKAKKSKVIVKKPFSATKKSGRANTVGDPQKRKKLQLRAQSKVAKKKPSTGKFTNPRFL